MCPLFSVGLYSCCCMPADILVGLLAGLVHAHYPDPGVDLNLYDLS
jgi:hypothetical protein